MLIFKTVKKLKRQTHMVDWKNSDKRNVEIKFPLVKNYNFSDIKLLFSFFSVPVFTYFMFVS